MKNPNGRLIGSQDHLRHYQLLRSFMREAMRKWLMLKRGRWLMSKGMLRVANMLKMKMITRKKKILRRKMGRSSQ